MRKLKVINGMEKLNQADWISLELLRQACVS